MSAISGVYGSYKSAEATEEAAELSAETSQAQFEATMKMWEPYNEVGLTGISELGTQGELPSWQETVYDPMQDWDYEQSAGYNAQLEQDMAALSSAQNARGLSSSGVAASQAAEVATDLTSQDYENEYAREYGELSDLYSGSLGEYQQRYDEIMNKIKVGTGAASSIQSAGETNTENQIASTTAEGEAESELWSGLGGVSSSSVSNALKIYDYGNENDWWDDSETA